MKKSLSTLALVCCAALTMAQQYLYINKTDGSQLRYNTKDIYSIAFEDGHDFIPATSISLSLTQMELTERNSTDIYAFVEPVNATEDVQWKSSNPAVVSVNYAIPFHDGTSTRGFANITARSEGTAYIIASIGNLQARCKVTVLPGQPEPSVEPTEGAVTIVWNIVDAEICSGLVFAGDYNEWNTDVATMAHFEPIVGYDGWYKAVITPADENNLPILTGKPCALEKDGTFPLLWDYQWIGTEEHPCEILQGDADITIEYGTERSTLNVYSTGVVYIRSYAFQENPCREIVLDDVTFNLTTEVPVSDGGTVEVIGRFNNWASFIPMTPTNSERTKWTITIPNIEMASVIDYTYVVNSDWYNHALGYPINGKNCSEQLENFFLNSTITDDKVYGFDNYGARQCTTEDYVTFDIAVTNIAAATATVSVVPSDNDVYYYVDLLPDYLWESGYTDAQIAGFIVEDLLNKWENNKDTYAADGITTFADAYLSQGSATFDYSGLSAATHYYALAFQVNLSNNSVVINTLYKTGFTTLISSYNTFSIRQDATDNTHIIITPTNNDPYYWTFCSVEDLEESYIGSAAFLWEQETSYLAEHGYLDNLISRGEDSFYTTDEFHEAGNYKVIVAGYNGGQTTAVFTFDLTVTQDMINTEQTNTANVQRRTIAKRIQANALSGKQIHKHLPFKTTK